VERAEVIVPSYRVLDERFRPLVIANARLERLWTGGRWLEGPVSFPAGRYVLFSDIPNDRVLRFDECDGSVSVFRQPCRNENGHARDRQGRLVSCEHQGRCVSRTEPTGSRTVLANRYEGKRFNSPNDVVVKSDDTIWFTDPTYGIDSDYEGDKAESEIGASHVYRLDPATGRVTAVATDMVRPNGLAFSPDERVLYVAETGASHVAGLPRSIRAYEVTAAGDGVGAGRVFATSASGTFDGFRCDERGNIWTSDGNAVSCYAPDGTHLGSIELPEIAANLCFGGCRTACSSVRQPHSMGYT
jgi:gluconolactonase